MSYWAVGEGEFGVNLKSKRGIEPGNVSPRHVYVYAVALDSLGQTSVAIQVIDANRERWPNNIDLSFLQVS